MLRKLRELKTESSAKSKTRSLHPSTGTFLLKNPPPPQNCGSTVAEIQLREFWNRWLVIPRERDRERERERERDRQTDRQTDGRTDRQTDRQTDRGRERGRERETGTKTATETERCMHVYVRTYVPMYIYIYIHMYTYICAYTAYLYIDTERDRETKTSSNNVAIVFSRHINPRTLKNIIAKTLNPDVTFFVCVCLAAEEKQPLGHTFNKKNYWTMNAVINKADGNIRNPQIPATLNSPSGI